MNKCRLSFFRLSILLILSFLGSLVIGCASSGIGTPGWLATSTTLAQYADGKIGPKIGRACVESYLGLFALGDSSLYEAKKQGNLKSVYTIDFESRSIFGLYAELCTVVTGQ